MSKKYEGGKQGWGSGTPSHRSQRRSNRTVNRMSKQYAPKKNRGCAVVIVGFLGAAGALAAGAASLRGWV